MSTIDVGLKKRISKLLQQLSEELQRPIRENIEKLKYFNTSASDVLTKACSTIQLLG